MNHYLIHLRWNDARYAWHERAFTAADALTQATTRFRAYSGTYHPQFTPIHGNPWRIVAVESADTFPFNIPPVDNWTPERKPVS